jgi:hypothetical protein
LRPPEAGKKLDQYQSEPLTLTGLNGDRYVSPPEANCHAKFCNERGLQLSSVNDSTSDCYSGSLGLNPSLAAY